MFINCLPTNLTSPRVHLYADDTAISVRASNCQELEYMLNNSLKEASVWMQKNKLTLNTKKTMAMCFGTKYTLKRVPDLNIALGENGTPALYGSPFFGLFSCCFSTGRPSFQCRMMYSCSMNQSSLERFWSHLGFEPTTLALPGCVSNQLGHHDITSLQNLELLLLNACYF